MAIYLSDLMTNGALPQQGTSGGDSDGVTAVIFVPACTTLSTSDKLLAMRLAPNVNVTDITIRSDDMDSATSLSISCGYDRPVVDPSKAYNATTNPYITNAVAAASTAYYVATSTTPYQASGVNTYTLGQAAIDNEFANNPVNGVANYIDLSLTPTVTAGGATAADGYIYVTVKFTGKTQTPGTFAGTSAFKYKTQY